MGRSGSGIAPNTNMNIIARNVKALPPRARVNGFRTVGLVFEVIVATPSGGGEGVTYTLALFGGRGGSGA